MGDFSLGNLRLALTGCENGMSLPNEPCQLENIPELHAMCECVTVCMGG